MGRARYIPSLVLLSGVILSIGIAVLLHRQYADQVRQDFERAARDRAMALRLGVSNSLLVGQSVAGLFAASAEVTRSEFAAFSRFILANTAYVQALEWAPRVMRGERDTFEALGYRIHEPDGDGAMVPAGERAEYFPVDYVEPYPDNDAVVGLDLGAEAERRQALEYAWKHNRPGSTGRIDRLHADGAQAVLTFFPTYMRQAAADSPGARRESLLGVVVMVMDLPALVESSLAHLEPGGVNLTLYDESAPEDQRFLYHHLSRTQRDVAATDATQRHMQGSGLSYSEVFDVNNRRWSLQMDAAPGYFEAGVTLEIWLVCAGMLAATLLLAAYLNLLGKREMGLRRDRQQLEQLVAERTRDLEDKNRELETFSYSIAHDLRSPLRAISGFSQILLEDAAHKFDADEKASLNRVVAASNHMARLIDDILELSRVNRGRLSSREVDLSALARASIERLEAVAGDRRGTVEWVIPDGIVARGDPDMLMLVLDNLLGNAWKYCAQAAAPRVEFGVTRRDGERLFYVRDNGVGFDMQYADKIFGVFERLHNRDQFEGTGIGLATVQRIVARHKGRVWAESAAGAGATFYFTLGEGES